MHDIVSTARAAQRVIGRTLRRPGPSTARRAAAVLATVGALTFAGGCGVDLSGGAADAETSADDRTRPTTLPAVTLRTLDGTQAVQASDLAGPTVVNLWATWCPPCRVELPAFQAVHADLGDQVRFIGVNQSEDPAAAQAYLDGVGVTYDQMVDDDGDLLTSLGVAGLPSTVFLAADGTWIVHSGALTEDYLRELIAEQFGIAS